MRKPRASLRAGDLAVAQPGREQHGKNTKTLRRHNTTSAVALQVDKKGRWRTVAKIAPLGGAMVLAVAIRNQHGTTQAVSLPLAVVDYAEKQGVRLFYRRDDRAGTMGRIALADMRRRGWIGKDGELYITLADLTPTPWRAWPYATETLRLGADLPPATPAAPIQMKLWAVAP